MSGNAGVKVAPSWPPGLPASLSVTTTIAALFRFTSSRCSRPCTLSYSFTQSQSVSRTFVLCSFFMGNVIFLQLHNLPLQFSVFQVNVSKVIQIPLVCTLASHINISELILSSIQLAPIQLLLARQLFTSYPGNIPLRPALKYFTTASHHLPPFYHLLLDSQTQPLYHFHLILPFNLAWLYSQALFILDSHRLQFYPLHLLEILLHPSLLNRSLYLQPSGLP